MVHVCRKEHFNAAHKLWNPKWSEEKNKAVFGPCSNENWHGHNFELIVTIKGRPDEDTGFVVDLKQLSTLIRNEVIDKVDHKNLNLEVAFLKGKFVSTENLAMGIWSELEVHIKALGVKLHSVTVQETENYTVEYFGT